MLDGCVPIEAYCQMYFESKDAVDKRIERGHWRKGVEYHMIDGVRGRWIDLKAVSEWVRKNSQKV